MGSFWGQYWLPPLYSPTHCFCVGGFAAIAGATKGGGRLEKRVRSASWIRARGEPGCGHICECICQAVGFLYFRSPAFSSVSITPDCGLPAGSGMPLILFQLWLRMFRITGGIRDAADSFSALAQDVSDYRQDPGCRFSNPEIRFCIHIHFLHIFYIRLCYNASMIFLRSGRT